MGDMAPNQDLDLYLSRLRLHFHGKVPKGYFKRAGHPFISTPAGLVLRPSLNRRVLLAPL